MLYNLEKINATLKFLDNFKGSSDEPTLELYLSENNASIKDVMCLLRVVRLNPPVMLSELREFYHVNAAVCTNQISHLASLDYVNLYQSQQDPFVTMIKLSHSGMKILNDNGFLN